jgi:hypothetical protein
LSGNRFVDLVHQFWAIGSSGSYGAGLSAFLLAHGEWVVEVDRPAWPARRNSAKPDELDAVVPWAAVRPPVGSYPI